MRKRVSYPEVYLGDTFHGGPACLVGQLIGRLCKLYGVVRRTESSKQSDVKHCHGYMYLPAMYIEEFCDDFELNNTLK